MNKEQATAAVQTMLAEHAARAARLSTIRDAMRPWDARLAQRKLAVSQTEIAQHPLDKLMTRSQTNFLPLILDQFSQSLKVSDYFGADDYDSAGPWKHWQRNSLDARQTGVHRAALQYGEAFVVVMPGADPTAPSIRGVSPVRMTALYGEPVEWLADDGGPVDDDWPIMAVEIRDQSIRLYDDEYVYFFGAKSAPSTATGWAQSLYRHQRNLEFIEKRAHGIGVCPVVRFRDRQLLDGEEQGGLIEPLINIQDRIDETTFEMAAAQYFAAFKQRYIMGWVPEDEAQGLKMKASDTWFFEEADVKAGQFDETPLDGYINSKNSAVRDLAAIAQVPAQNLGSDSVSNVSAEGLASLESARDRKANEIQTSLGESWEQVFRTAAFVEGDEKSATDFESEVKWVDATARSFAQQVDGLGKLAQMLDVPVEVLWELIPGWDRGMARRAAQIAAERAPLAQLNDGFVR